MKKQIIFITCMVASTCFTSCSQTSSQKQNTPHIGGNCDGCKAIFESPVPFEKLSSADTLPDFNEPGLKIKISGIIYENEGKTPAKDVVLYVYHTDQTGHYTTKGNETGLGKRHGYIRGWVKTGNDGYYAFYTLKPAPYPNKNIPAHIHPVIKESGKNEYWIDEYLFDDDPLLTPLERNKQERGGSGIVQLRLNDGMLEVTRNIILGKNIPDYPLPKIEK